jgi:hypothetical protein
MTEPEPIPTVGTLSACQDRFQHQRNSEEENSGYVVFKRKIHWSDGKQGDGEGGRGYSARPLSSAGFWTDIQRRCVRLFSLPRMFAPWVRISRVVEGIEGGGVGRGRARSGSIHSKRIHLIPPSQDSMEKRLHRGGLTKKNDPLMASREQGEGCMAVL